MKISGARSFSTHGRLLGDVGTCHSKPPSQAASIGPIALAEGNGRLQFDTRVKLQINATIHKSMQMEDVHHCAEALILIVGFCSRHPIGTGQPLPLKLT